MRYYTKEWYELMQKTELTAGLRKVPDKKYTKKDIDALYEKTLKREMAAEKKAYNTAPDLGYLLDILNDRGFCAEDWVVTDLKTGKPRTPASMEEVKNFILEEQQAQTEEFEAREPFSEEDFREMFRDVYEDRKAELKYGTGSELLDSVDRRLLALELVPESVFAALKEEERLARKEFSRIGRNAERALLKQNVPQDIIEGLSIAHARRVGQQLYILVLRDVSQKVVILITEFDALHGHRHHFRLTGLDSLCHQGVVVKLSRSQEQARVELTTCDY